MEEHEPQQATSSLSTQAISLSRLTQGNSKARNACKEWMTWPSAFKRRMTQIVNAICDFKSTQIANGICDF